MSLWYAVSVVVILLLFWRIMKVVKQILDEKIKEKKT